MHNNFDAETHEASESLQRRGICQEIATLIRNYDVPEKALTGRQPYMYESHSGISHSELFPQGGSVLNIGDPYQKVDLPGVTILEYESGEEARFTGDYIKGWNNLPGTIDKFTGEVLSLYQRICQEHNEPVSAEVTNIEDDLIVITGLLADIRDIEQSTEKYQLMGEASEIIRTVADAIAKLTKEIPNGNDSRFYSSDIIKAWYRCQGFALLIQDLVLWEESIRPELLQESIRLGGVSDTQESEIIRRIVARERFIKKTQHAEVIKGAWPEVEFNDQQFDRIIASWSITAHIFRVMKPHHFVFFFDEMSRILKPDGVAYLWPMDHWYSDYGNLLTGVTSYVDDGGDAVVVTINNECVSYAKEPRYFISQLENRNVSSLAILPKHSNKDKIVERMRAAMLHMDSESVDSEIMDENEFEF